MYVYDVSRLRQCFAFLESRDRLWDYLADSRLTFPVNVYYGTNITGQKMPLPWRLNSYLILLFSKQITHVLPQYSKVYCCWSTSVHRIRMKTYFTSQKWSWTDQNLCCECEGSGNTLPWQRYFYVFMFKFGNLINVQNCKGFVK